MYTCTLESGHEMQAFRLPLKYQVVKKFVTTSIKGVKLHVIIFVQLFIHHALVDMKYVTSFHINLKLET